MDDRYSPQPSTSEVKEVLVDSDEAEDVFEEDETPKKTLPKVKVKRQKRPPDPTDPIVIAAAAAAAKAEAEAEAAERFHFSQNFEYFRLL